MLCTNARNCNSHCFFFSFASARMSAHSLVFVGLRIREHWKRKWNMLKRVHSTQTNTHEMPTHKIHIKCSINQHVSSISLRRSTSLFEQKWKKKNTAKITTILIYIRCTHATCRLHSPTNQTKQKRTASRRVRCLRLSSPHKRKKKTQTLYTICKTDERKRQPNTYQVEA